MPSAEVGLRNSLILEFSATAWSNFVRRSFIWEDWALIFLSFLVWDLVTAPSSSDSVSVDAAVRVLTDAFAAVCWQVPRTLASSLRNCVNVICGICFSRVFAINTLLQLFSWFMYLCFKVISKSFQKSGFLLMTFWASICSSSAKASFDYGCTILPISLPPCHLLGRWRWDVSADPGMR